MKKFQFRLESVLKVRLVERNRLRARLAEAYQAQQTLRAKMAGLENQIQRVRQQALQASLPGRIDADQLLQVRRYELHLGERLDECRQQGVRIDQEVERRRAALIDADRQVHVMEKLREKQWHGYLDQQFREEIKQLDEINQRRPRT